MPEDVRGYYERNTRIFLRSGGASQRTGTMHRSLQLPSTTGDWSDVHAVHELIARVIEQHLRPGIGDEKTGPRVADLGCGVGASVSWMHDHTSFDPVGITLSEVQAEMARKRLGREAVIVTGSYDDPNDLARLTRDGSIDAAYMIESFVHAPDAIALLRAVARVSRPGSVLVVCDDFAADDTAPDGAADRRTAKLVREFRWGWHVNTFVSADEAAGLAAQTGWEHVQTVDLSPHVVTSRPRDLIARLLSHPAKLLGARSPLWRNVRGGSALQRLIRSGGVRYQLLVFVRADV